MAASPRFPRRPFKWLLLAVLAGLGSWYAGDAVVYAFVRDRPAEEIWLRRAGSGLGTRHRSNLRQPGTPLGPPVGKEGLPLPMTQPIASLPEYIRGRDGVDDARGVLSETPLDLGVPRSFDLCRVFGLI